MNLACCDKNKAVIFEITPKTVGVRNPEGDILRCTNHFVLPNLTAGVRCERFRTLGALIDFKAGEKFKEPDPSQVDASFLYADAEGYHFMDQESFETLTLRAETIGDDRLLLVDNVMVQVQRYNGNPIGLQFPPHVELTVTSCEPGVRGDTASGGVTKNATLETGLEIRVPLFIKEGEKVKVHTETREFAGRA